MNPARKSPNVSSSAQAKFQAREEYLDEAIDRRGNDDAFAQIAVTHTLARLEGADASVVQTIGRWRAHVRFRSYEILGLNRPAQIGFLSGVIVMIRRTLVSAPFHMQRPSEIDFCR